MKPSMSMFASTEAYDAAIKKWRAENEVKLSCPHEGKSYCEYPYCSCKEKTYETK